MRSSERHRRGGGGGVARAKAGKQTNSRGHRADGRIDERAGRGEAEGW